MALPIDLVNEFVKVTYDENTDKQPSTAYATVVVNQNGSFVQIDGSAILTPAVFAVSAHNGDRVMITIQNRKVIVTNNITTPAITTGVLEANTGIIVHGYLTTNDKRILYNDQNHSGLTFSSGGIGAYGTNGYWYVTDNGNLYASNAVIAGSVTASSGYLGSATNGFTIDQYGIYSGAKNGTSNGYITLSNGDFSRSIGGTTRNNLRLAIGSGFAVSSNGTLYANNADITGKITATSGSISGDLLVGTINGQLIGDGTIGLDQLGTEVTNELDATIREVERQYAVTNAPDPSGIVESDWSAVVPEYVDGQYIWERTVVTYGSGNTDTTYPVPLTGNSGPTGATGASGANGQDAAILRIDSSRGNQFINKDISTVLTVTIFYGSLKITDITALRSAFGSGSYLQWYWRRLTDDSFGLILSTDSKLSDNGFSMTLTPNDVDRKVTFMCELVV